MEGLSFKVSSVYKQKFLATYYLNALIESSKLAFVLDAIYKQVVAQIPFRLSENVL